MEEPKVNTAEAIEKENVQEKKKKKGILPKILFGFLIAILVLGGIAAVLYPYISNTLYENQQDEIATTYDEQLEGEDDAYLDEEYQRAVDFNTELASIPIILTDPFEATIDLVTDDYYDLLNIHGTGEMGYVEIPCIDVKLTIFHGTEEDALLNGVGHLENSSLPVGGASTHSVLTGHTGLTTKKLFTDLDQMQIGDIFYIHVLNQVLTYEVDQIKIVEPTTSC